MRFFSKTHVSNNSRLARIALSISRKGAFPSMIVVELCYVCAYFFPIKFLQLLIWSGLLWILWLAVGGTSANLPSDNLDYCRALSGTYCGNFRRISSHNNPTVVGSSCWLIYDTVIQVMAASSFLNFILREYPFPYLRVIRLQFMMIQSSSYGTQHLPPLSRHCPSQSRKRHLDKWRH